MAVEARAPSGRPSARAFSASTLFKKYLLVWGGQSRTWSRKHEGVYMPVGVYRPVSTYVPVGTHRPVGTYMPVGVYRPDGTCVPVEVLF